MARPELRLAANAEGDFYVDSTCIDCDACRQIAPRTFRADGDRSIVYRQPSGREDELRATMALVACPTGSIGAPKAIDRRPGIAAFPEPLSENVSFCGFTAESSFGAWSYLISRPPSEGGNVLVDSPRFAAPLVSRLADKGGVSTLFLTHRDDVADHEKFARRFACRRYLHASDGGEKIGVEVAWSGDGPLAIGGDLLAIPVPGHTRGHSVLLYRNKYLFSGDHLAWSPSRNRLTAFRGACWYSWEEQIRSMRRLLEYSFEWVLPGHGRIHRAPAGEMRESLQRCIEWMEQAA